MSGKAKLAFCVGVTKSWMFAAANAMLSIRKHFRGPQCDFVVFVETEPSSEERRIFRDISERACFQRFDPQRIRSEKFKRVSNMAFARFDCFPLLDHYENVVWIDADACCVGDISGMLDCNTAGIAMFKHAGIPMRVSFCKDVPGVNMDLECYNDGIFLLSDRIARYQEIGPLLFSFTDDYMDFINSDQAVVNLMLQKCALAVSELPGIYNQRPENATSDSRILHPWGEGKFWNRYYLDEWDCNYLIWKKLGGPPQPDYEVFRAHRKHFMTRLLRPLRKFKALAGMERMPL